MSYNQNMDVKKEKYFRNPLNTVLKVSAVYTIHYFRYGKNFRYPLESHSFWEMVFIDSGEANIVAGEKTFKMNQSEVCFHAPDVEHTISTDDDFSNSVIVSFEASGRIMNFFEDRIFTLNESQKRLLNDIVTEAKLAFDGRLDDPNQTKMIKKDDAPFGSSQVIKNSLELLLISIIKGDLSDKEKEGSKKSNISPHADKIVENIIEILKSHINTGISLDEIANSLFFSKTYIKSVFKKNMHTSIIKYYNELKISEAKKLISLNKYTITEITYMLGFSSVHYFSRLFKQTTDMTPSEYARSIKAENVLI